jgi:hypothetical protein
MASSVKVTFKANRAGINSVTRTEGVMRDLERRADLVIADAAANVHTRTGEYVRGLKKARFRAKGGAGGVRVTAHADHSAVLEFGSRPHIIEPKDKQALSWAGAEHPWRRVHHPGTSAQHILRNALRAARG